MRCKIASKLYMLVVKYEVVEEDGDPQYTWCPVIHQPEPRDAPQTVAYIDKVLADAEMADYLLRFPTAEYKVIEVLVR